MAEEDPGEFGGDEAGEPSKRDDHPEEGRRKEGAAEGEGPPQAAAPMGAQQWQKEGTRVMRAHTQTGDLARSKETVRKRNATYSRGLPPS